MYLNTLYLNTLYLNAPQLFKYRQIYTLVNTEMYLNTTKLRHEACFADTAARLIGCS